MTEIKKSHPLHHTVSSAKFLPSRNVVLDIDCATKITIPREFNKVQLIIKNVIISYNKKCERKNYPIIKYYHMKLMYFYHGSEIKLQTNYRCTPCIFISHVWHYSVPNQPSFRSKLP